MTAQEAAIPPLLSISLAGYSAVRAANSVAIKKTPAPEVSRVVAALDASVL